MLMYDGGSFNLENLPMMKFLDTEDERYGLKYGDLVICEGGEPGRCAVWENDETIFYQKALHRVRFTDDSNPRFYMYFFWFAAHTGQLKPLFTGTGIKHLTGQSLVKVSVPTISRKEQDSLVSQIESQISICDYIEQSIIRGLQQVNAIRQSILKQFMEE